MISYWHYTNETTYVEEVGQAILSQSSPTNDFLMPNQVYDTGNDDQAFWALTAMVCSSCLSFDDAEGAEPSNHVLKAYRLLSPKTFMEDPY